MTEWISGIFVVLVLMLLVEVAKLYVNREKIQRLREDVKFQENLRKDQYVRYERLQAKYNALVELIEMKVPKPVEKKEEKRSHHKKVEAKPLYDNKKESKTLGDLLEDAKKPYDRSDDII